MSLSPPRPTSLLPILLSLTLLVSPQKLDASGVTALPGLDRGELASADLDKGTVIVVVWASWSPSSRDVVPRLNALARRWSKRARLVGVVFQEDAATVRQFLAGKRLDVQVFLDVTGSFARQHGVTTLPALLVFKEGEVAFSGKLPSNPDLAVQRVLG